MKSSSPLVLGIDVSNITAGGLLKSTSLLLAHASLSPFDRIVLFGGEGHKLESLADGSRVQFVPQPMLSRSGWQSHHGSVPRQGFRALATQFWRHAILPRQVKQHGITVLFCPNTLSPLGSREFKLVVSQHNMLPFDPAVLQLAPPSVRHRQTLLGAAHLACLNRSDGVIFLSAYAQSQIVPRMKAPPAKQTVILNGTVRDDSPRAPEARPMRRMRLLYVSSIDFYKQHATLLKAIAGLPHFIRDQIELILAGWPHEPYLSEVGQLVQELSLSGQVEYKGVLATPDLAAEYRSADIFVFPSLCENCPTALQEAMTHGLPIVASNLGPMPELLQSAGLLVDPRDEVALRTAIQQLVESRVAREELSQAALKRSQAFDVSARCADVYSFLASV